MKVFIFVSLFELIRPREVVCEHLHACATISAIDCHSFVSGIAGNDMNWTVLVTVWRHFGVRLGSILGRKVPASKTNYFLFR